MACRIGKAVFMAMATEEAEKLGLEREAYMALNHNKPTGAKNAVKAWSGPGAALGSRHGYAQNVFPSFLHEADLRWPK